MIKQQKYAHCGNMHIYCTYFRFLLLSMVLINKKKDDVFDVLNKNYKDIAYQ